MTGPAHLRIAVLLPALMACATLPRLPEQSHETPVAPLPASASPSPTITPIPLSATLTLPAANTARLLPTASGHDPSDPHLGFPLTRPVPLGYSFDSYSFSLLAVVDVIRPADALVAELRPDFPQPETGTDYLVAVFSMDCTAQADSWCSWDGNEKSYFRLIDPEGNEYEPVWDPRPSNLTRLVARGGENLTLNLAFAVPSSLPNPVLLFGYYMQGEYYFALE